MRKSPRFAALVFLVWLPLMLGNCTMREAGQTCFTRYRVSLPTAAKVLPNLTNGEAGRRLYDAISAGDVGKVTQIVGADRRLLTTHTRLPAGESPYDGNTGDVLSFAIARCDVGMLATLLDLGADANGQRAGEPLTLALLADDLTMAELLFQAGARPDAHGHDAQSAMAQMLAFGKLDAIALLLRRQADPNAAAFFGATPLQDALTFGNYAAAEMLMQAGANPWQVGSKGDLPARQLLAPAGDRANETIRQRLVAKARHPNLPWPPPEMAEVQTRFVSAQWPTAEMKAAGFVASEGAMRSMRQSVANRPASSAAN